MSKYIFTVSYQGKENVCQDVTDETEVKLIEEPATNMELVNGQM